MAIIKSPNPHIYGIPDKILPVLSTGGKYWIKMSNQDWLTIIKHDGTKWYTKEVNGYWIPSNVKRSAG